MSNAFHLWREGPAKSALGKRTLPNGQYKVRPTVANTLWSSHLIKSKNNSSGLLWGIFFGYLKKTLKRRFLFWKRYARKSKYMMIRFFDKWNVKTSRMILNRMNINRFSNILNDKMNKLNNIKMKNYFIIFIKRVCHLKMMEKLKFHFISWRICTKAIIAGKKCQKKYYVKLWKDYLMIVETERKVSTVFIVRLLQFILTFLMLQVEEQTKFTKKNYIPRNVWLLIFYIDDVSLLISLPIPLSLSPSLSPFSSLPLLSGSFSLSSSHPTIMTVYLKRNSKKVKTGKK